MDLALAGHVFLVTGASRGLGRATARALVAEGARVVVSSRDAEAIAAAAHDLGGPEHAVAVAADNADSQTPARLIAAARDAFGRIDGGLINASGPPAGSATDTGDDAWRAAFETAFLGAVRLARVLAAELEAGGSIAFILSTSVRAPIPDLALSNGLRPAVAGLAKTLADELGPRGIRVNGLLPGRIDTRRVHADSAIGDPEEARRRVTAAIPLGRYGTPEEFAAVAAFLLSPAASYLTGVMLPVDGGALRAL